MPTNINDISLFILEALMNSAEAQADSIDILIKFNGDGRKEFKITDNGKGIPHENLGDVFKAGFTSKSNGRGHGLSIIRTFAENSGGKVMIDSYCGNTVLFSEFGNDFKIPIGDLEKSIRSFTIINFRTIKVNFRFEYHKECSKIFSFSFENEKDATFERIGEINSFLKDFFKEINQHIFEIEGE